MSRAIERFTHHLTTCEKSITRMVSGKCTCGLSQALAELKKQLPITSHIQCPDEECCGCLVEGELLGDIVCNECGKSYCILSKQPPVGEQELKGTDAKAENNS